MELQIGRVIKSHGIRGEVSVDITTDDPATRFAVGEVLTGRHGNRELHLTIASVRPHQGRLLISFEEIPDRTAADTLRGLKFFAAPLDDADDDGFYDHELEGLTLIEGGRRIGTVTGVIHPAGRTILEARLDDSLGAKDVMIPFVYEIVPDVDLDAGTATITPPPGLLDL
ncbi:ribosome maturation factor RimM [Corynebacterium uterequi]|uniref:Ribosome maturation factor RimM n=1 Tax=Corynebacterium uterequi TaxID=1072256 RepID=A0A0G3HDI1_9CORY|nr:ribosome maturation factor RimM [Corynebacterium uterequi]AKK11369.1 16S rRNA processing protein RimM [Corynebacterium uterequi]